MDRLSDFHDGLVGMLVEAYREVGGKGCDVKALARWQGLALVTRAYLRDMSASEFGAYVLEGGVIRRLIERESCFLGDRSSLGPWEFSLAWDLIEADHRFGPGREPLPEAVWGSTEAAAVFDVAAAYTGLPVEVLARVVGGARAFRLDRSPRADVRSVSHPVLDLIRVNRPVSDL